MSHLRWVLRYVAWPLTVLILAWVFYAPLKVALEGVTEVNAGPFRAKLEKAVKHQGIAFKTSELATLTMDQLQMFLILGGEKGQELSVEFRHGATDKLLRDLEALDKLGLIKIDRKKSTTEKSMGYDTTPDGRKVHKLIMDQLYEELVQRPNRA